MLSSLTAAFFTLTNLNQAGIHCYFHQSSNWYRAEQGLSQIDCKAQHKHQKGPSDPCGYGHCKESGKVQFLFFYKLGWMKFSTKVLKYRKKNLLPERLEELYKFHKSHVTIRHHKVLKSLHSSFDTAMPATAAPCAKSKKDCCSLITLSFYLIEVLCISVLTVYLCSP